MSSSILSPFGFSPFPSQLHIKKILENQSNPNIIQEAQPDTEIQRNYSDTLWKIIQNYQQSTIPKKRTFIQRVWDNFIRLIQWVAGRLFRFNKNEIKMHLAMNLFRNYDPSLLTDLKNGAYSLPFSVALESYCNILKLMPDYFGMSEQQLSALRYCLDVTKQVEAMRFKSRSRCLSSLKSLMRNINLRLDKLNPGESLYLPGGYIKYVKFGEGIDWSKQSELSSQQSDCFQLIYQMTKNPDDENSILFKVYNHCPILDVLGEQEAAELEGINQNSNPVDHSDIDLQTGNLKKTSPKQYSLSISEFKDQLFTLLEVQVTPHKNYKLGWIESISYRLQAIFNITVSRSIENMSVIRLANFFCKYNPTMVPANPTAKHSSAYEPVKLIEVFSTIHLGRKEKFRKLAQKTLVFLEIYDQLKNQLSEDHVRKWLRDNLVLLLTSYKELFTFESNENIVAFFNGITDEINKAEEKSAFSYPPGPPCQTANPAKFQDSVCFDHQTIKLSSLKSLPSKGDSQAFSSMQLDQNLRLSEILNAGEIFAAKLKVCHHISRQGNLENLDYALYDLHNLLAYLDLESFFDILSGEEARFWTKQIYEMVTLTTYVHFGLNKSGPVSGQILALLRAIKICQTLTINNADVTCYKSFRLDMDVFKDILKDDYLDLGSDGSKIHGIIDAIEGKNEEVRYTLLDLTNPNHSDLLSNGDREFFDHYRDKKQAKFKNLDSKDKKRALEEDFGAGKGLLAQEIIHLRNIKVFASALMAKYRCLGSPSLYKYLKDSISIILKPKGNQFSDLDLNYLNSIITEITQITKSLQLPYTLKKKKYLFVQSQTINIASSPLDYIPYTKPVIHDIISPFAAQRYPSQYTQSGPPVPEALAKNILEGCISQCENHPIDENGIPLKPETVFIYKGKEEKKWSERDKTHHIATGECHTESYIYSDNKSEFNLQADVWADLRAMQTQPHKTRIPNTLGTFLRYSGLLGKSKDRLAWQRIFSLNMFKDNALATFLKEKPSYAETLIGNLSSFSTLMSISQDVQGMLFIMIITSQIQAIICDNKSLFLYESKINALTSEHYKKICTWVKSCDKKKIYRPHQYAIHQTFLLLSSEILKNKLINLKYDFLEDRQSHSIFLSLLRSYFMIRQMPQLYSSRNPSHDERILHMMQRLFPICENILKTQETKAWRLLDSCVPTHNTASNNIQWEKNPKFLCFQKGSLKIDLFHGLLFQEGVAKCVLPDFIINNPAYSEIFCEEDIHTLVCNCQMNEFEGLQGWQYEFLYNQRKYCIVVLPHKEPLIYKETPSPGRKLVWHFLYHPNQSDNQQEDVKSFLQDSISTFSPPFKSNQKDETKSSLPVSVLLQNHCWISTTGNNFIIEDSSGKCLYVGELSLKQQTGHQFEKQIKKIFKYEKDLFVPILNPWNNKGFERFLALAPPSQILAKGDRYSKVTEIQYLNYKLEYEWNAQHSYWECLSLPGYRLSSKKVEAIFLNKHTNPRENHFFDANFSHYHLLEHYNKPSKLILTFQEYKKSHDSKATPLLKGKQCIPVPVDLEKSKLPHILYQYTVDPFGTLKSSAEGYFYLTYLFYTQSKYEQGLYYLKKARDIKPELSYECQKTLEWIHTWNDTTVEGQVFMLHASLLVLEQSPTIEKTAQFDKNQKKLLIQLLFNYDCYLNNRHNLKPFFRLSIREENNINDYIELIQKHIADFSDDIKGMFSEEANANAEELKCKLNFHFEDLDPSTRLREIKDQIDDLNAILMQRSTNVKSSDDEWQEPIIYEPIFPQFQEYLTDDSKFIPSGDLQDELESLSNLFKNGTQNFVNEIGSSLVEDIWIAITQQKSEKNKLIPNFPHKEIAKKLTEKSRHLAQEINELKKSIMHKVVTPPPLINLSWDKPLRDLKDQSEYQERYFDEILFSRATNSWDNLTLLQLSIHESDHVTVDKEVREYLEKKTCWQQYNQAINLIHQYISNPLPKIKSRLGELLATHRHYEPCSDPHAVSILLLESELQIIARKSQIDHFRIMFEKINLYKHEALASGKTTFLRNLISKRKANGFNLSCIITHDPLIAIHHKQLETATSEAYGDKAYRFEFNRQSPTDKFSLYLIFRNLLKIILNKGRLDFTPNDILSLRHAFLLKHHELENSLRDINEIHEEIDILGDIIQKTFKELACTNSDEIDKILEASKQHNYSIGKTKKLNKIKCKVALHLVEWILSDEKYKNLFKSNLLWAKSDDLLFIKSFQTDMAICIFDNLLNDHLSKDNKSHLICYMIEPVIVDPTNELSLIHKQKISDFEANVLLKLPKNLYQQLRAFRRFLQITIPHTFNKRNGLDSMRSENGIQIKPVVSNGVCNEVSEHGTEEESIWYSVLTYMASNDQGGVIPEQIAQLVLNAHNNSSSYIMKQMKENPGCNLSYSRAPAAIKFKNSFGIELENVTAEDYPRLAKTINDDPSLLSYFLKHYVLPLTEVSPKQIVGTSHHLVAMFKEFSGSSGTSNIWRSLPSKIEAIDEYVKQQGVDGAVFLAFLKDFKPETLILTDPQSQDVEQTFIVYDERKNISQQFAILLQKKKGSTLVDCAPAFPGMTADKIAENLSPFMPEARLRFTNKEDREIVFDTSTKKIKPEGEIVVEEDYTILDNAQKRGTHKELPDTSIGIISVNKLTTLTDFSQAVMRMRKFGKGQKIRIAIDTPTYNWLNQRPNTTNFIEMLCRNEVEFLKTQHHEKSEIQIIQALTENAIYDQLLNIKDKSLRKIFWKHCHSFFIKDSQEPLDQLDDYVLKPTSTVLKDLAHSESKRIRDFINHLQDANFEAFSTTIQALNEVEQKLRAKASGENLMNSIFLPTYTLSNKFNIGMHNYVQKDLNINRDMDINLDYQQELELNKENMKSDDQPVILEWRDLKIDSVECLVEYLEKPEHPSNISLFRLKDYVKFYDSNLFFTHNLFDPSHQLLPWGMDKLYLPSLDGHTRLNKVAIVIDHRNKKPKVYAVAGSLTDFDENLNSLDGKNDKNSLVDYYICDIFNNDELQGHQTQWKDYDQAIQKKIARAIVQIKLLAGELELPEFKSEQNSIIKSQFTIFKKWLEQKCSRKALNPITLEKNLLNYLVNRRPSLLENYSESSMAKAFAHCKNLFKQTI
jgi:hypothetical protein